jgi:hypothetical protein
MKLELEFDVSAYEAQAEAVVERARGRAVEEGGHRLDDPQAGRARRRIEGIHDRGGDRPPSCG